MALLSAAMGVTCRALHAGLTHVLPGDELAPAIVRLAIAVVAGLAVTVLGARWLRVPEAGEILARLRAIVARR